jgi:NarL family two-component system response regulator LiaR
MANVDPIRVMIVDDHTVVRSGIRYSLLAFPDLELVAEAGNGREAVELCDRLWRSSALPDVILMDMVMPEMDGIAATQAILEQHLEVHVVALTSFESGALVREALRAGAIGYLLKDVSIDEMADAIRAAHAGEGTLTPAAARALVTEVQGRQVLGDDLTDRELEVLALVVEGMSNQQIAQQLSISLSTARSHVSTILSKLAAANRAEAAALAVQHGLVAHTGHLYRDTTGQNPNALARELGYDGDNGWRDLRAALGQHVEKT